DPERGRRLIVSGSGTAWHKTQFADSRETINLRPRSGSPRAPPIASGMRSPITRNFAKRSGAPSAAADINAAAAHSTAIARQPMRDVNHIDSERHAGARREWME